MLLSRDPETPTPPATIRIFHAECGHMSFQGFQDSPGWGFNMAAGQLGNAMPRVGSIPRRELTLSRDRGDLFVLVLLICELKFRTSFAWYWIEFWLLFQ